MKKIMAAAVLLCVFCALATGCGAENAADENARQTAAGENAPNADAETSIDIDLTKLSSTMQTAQINNIYMDPDSFTGKVVKFAGQYFTDFFDETNQYYHLILMYDETSCCSFGFEFIRNGEHKYPADYPEQGAMIEVTGVFGSYEELGQTYYHLTVDDVVMLG